MLFPIGVIGFCAIHYHKVRIVINQFFFCWAYEHVFDKVSLPCDLGNKTHFQTGVFICAAVGIYHKQAFAAELFCHCTFEVVPHGRRNRFIVVFTLIRPPNGIFGDVIAHYVFVFRGATGELACVHVDGT